jgi:peptide/nickel transport system substrate-binding protein
MRARSGFFAVAALVVVTACGGGGGSAGTTGPAVTESTAAEVVTTTVPIIDVPVVTSGGSVTDTTEVPASGSLRVGVATDVQTLDPHLAQPAQQHFLDLVYDSLTTIGDDGGVEPLLASSIVSDDLITWTVTLAEGATFSDGSPVDAAAVKYSLERGKALAESPSAPSFAQIASITADDDSTVTITLTQPNVAFPRDLASLPGMIVNPAAEGSDLSRAPAGAGPFLFDASATVEGAEYRYTLRPDYWGPGVGVEEITLSLIVDPVARVNALRSGQIDIAAELGPADQAALDDGTELVLAPSTEQIFIQVIDSDGTVVPALGDPRVRQAISLAIDREGIRDAIFFGGGLATTAWFPPGSPYYSAEIDEVGYDPEAARALLAEAGYADGFTFDTPTVEPLRTITEAVAASLAQVGITMNIELQQPGTLGQQIRDGLWAAGLTITRGQTAQSFYADRFGPGAPFNAFDADRTSVIELGEAALAATAEEEANELWAQTYVEAVRQGYVIVVGQITTGAALASGVTGARVPFGSLLPDLRSVRVDS